MHTKDDFRARFGYRPTADSADDAREMMDEAVQLVRSVLVELGDASGPANSLYAAGLMDRTGTADHALMVGDDIQDLVVAFEELQSLWRMLNVARGEWGRAVQDFYNWRDLEADGAAA